jgi:hypothetical protein
MEKIDLGPELSPPRGGLSRLQHSIQKPHRHRALIKIWAPIATAAALLALALFLWLPRSNPQYQIQHAVQESLSSPTHTHFDNAAYITLASHRRDVRILIIARLPKTPNAGGNSP